jgi:hypothetical protein
MNRANLFTSALPCFNVPLSCYRLKVESRAGLAGFGECRFVGVVPMLLKRGVLVAVIRNVKPFRDATCLPWWSRHKARHLPHHVISYEQMVACLLIHFEIALKRHCSFTCQ